MLVRMRLNQENILYHLKRDSQQNAQFIEHSARTPQRQYTEP